MTGSVAAQVARTVEEHLAAVLAGARPLPAEQVPLADALGRVLAAPVTAGLDLPRFDNAAMDGYAVRCADTATATAAAPVELPVRGDVAAGTGPGGAVAPGTAVRIMTGAPVPAGTGAVVPVEWTDRGTDRVRIDRPAPAGANVRRSGEDVRTGDELLAAGTVVTPGVVALLAGTGQAAVAVHARPRVVVLSTGTEVVPPGDPLGPAQIYDANGPMLVAAARAAGADAVLAPAVRDEPEAVRRAVDRLSADADVVVTSAGISEGAYDVVRADLAGDLTFARVAMQPGRPQGAGHVGRRRVPVVALPGNPASAFVSFHVFVRPLVDRLAGRRGPSWRVVAAVLGEAVPRSPEGRRQLLRARLEVGPDGRLVATPAGAPGSHLLRGLAAADCLVVVPEHVTALDAGAGVEVILTDGDAS